VKNQQGLAAEVLPIGAGEGLAVLNFLHSRDRLSGENFSRAARLAIRQGRIYGGEAAVWRGFAPPPNVRVETGL
jgi:hypothetical protein